MVPTTNQSTEVPAERGETTDDWSDENLFGDLGFDANRDSDNPSFEGTGGGDFFNGFDPSVLGIPPGGLEMDMGLHEGHLEGSHDASGAFNQAAQGYLSHAKKRRGSSSLAKVTAEDFDEGAEQNAFHLIMHFAHKLLNKSSKEKDFLEGLIWFFTADDIGDLTFELCCEVLQARPDVIRLRIQYEWWMQGTRFTGPFDFNAVGAPNLMRGETLFHGGAVGYALAREIWVQPGIPTDELLFEVGNSQEGATPENMRKALEALHERYILSIHNGWYFTGRNPMLMNQRSPGMFNADLAVGGSVHWARLFG